MPQLVFFFLTKNSILEKNIWMKTLSFKTSDIQYLSRHFQKQKFNYHKYFGLINAKVLFIFLSPNISNNVQHYATFTRAINNLIWQQQK